MLQGTKAVVYDPGARRVLSRASESYGILPTDVPGRAEQDPNTWLQVSGPAPPGLGLKGLRVQIKGNCPVTGPVPRHARGRRRVQRRQRVYS